MNQKDPALAPRTQVDPIRGAALPKGFRILVATKDGGEDVREGCGKTGNCPTVYEMENGDIAVQGFKSDAGVKVNLEVPDSEDLIVLPRTFFDKIIRKLSKGQ